MSSELVALGDVCDITMGQAPKGDTYNHEGVGWPLIAGAGDFGEFHPAIQKFTSATNVRLCRPGDLVLGIRASIGEKVLADSVYCLGRGVAGLRCRSALDSRYLWHWISFGSHELAQRGRGATFKQVNKSDLVGWEIPLPPLEEQRRIATVLDAVDALRAKRRLVLSKLDTLTQAIFIDMFGDPVCNRRGWRMASLMELGKLDRGVSKHRPRNDPVLFGGRWPLIQTGDVSTSGGYITDFETTYSDTGLEQSKIWPSGTLCITIAANIAKTGILTFDACFPDSVVGFTAEREGASEFVRSVLDHLQPILEQQAPESAQKNINLKVLRGLQVPIPPESLMAEYARRVVEVTRQKTRTSQHFEQLDMLFASLQQRAFRGEL